MRPALRRSTWDRRAAITVIRLAGEHGLTVYGAAYLDLAIDVDADLATDDRKLQAAARAEAVPVVD